MLEPRRAIRREATNTCRHHDITPYRDPRGTGLCRIRGVDISKGLAPDADGTPWDCME